MCRSRRGTMKRNEARERSTNKNGSMRFVLKRGIPKPRSVRDRSLKRKYGGRKSRAKKQNNKSTSRARRRHHRLKFPAGCSDLPKSTNFHVLLFAQLIRHLGNCDTLFHFRPPISTDKLSICRTAGRLKRSA